MADANASARAGRRAPHRQHAVAFSASAALVAFLALRGGTFDIVDRQEVGLLIWWVLAFGLGLGLLPRARPARMSFLPLLVLALLGGWTLLSLNWTASDERTFAEVTRIATYGGFLLLVLLAVDRHNWRAAAAGLTTGALAVAALASASRLAPDLFPDDPVRSVAGTRLNYPFDYWNAVGAWGAMAVSAGLVWSLTATSIRYRAVFLAALPAAALSIYLSYSRASVGGLLIGVAVAIFLGRPRLVALAHTATAGLASAAVIAVARGNPEIARGEGTEGAAVVVVALFLASAACGVVAILMSRVDLGARWSLPAHRVRPVALAAAAIVVIVLAVFAPPLVSRAWDSFKETEVATSADPAERLGSLHGTRYLLWSAALDEFAGMPARGTGAGTFEFTWNQDGRSPEFARDAHSIYVEPLSELGLPGAVLTLAFLASIAFTTVAAQRSARRSGTRGAAAACLAVLAVWLVQAGVDWMWEVTAVSMLALGGAALSWTRLGAYGSPRRLPLRVRLPAAGACLLVCALMLPGLASNTLIRDSNASVRAKDLAAARELADDAVEAEPWSASAMLQRAAVAEAAANLPAARVDLLRAAAREPRNWRPPLLLSRVEAELGRPAAALRQFRRARRLRPRAVVFEAAAEP